MTDDAIRLATIGRMLRRRGRLLAAVALVGALVGYGVSLVFPPRYTTSASVLLSGQWEERELLTQAEIATSSSVVDRAAGVLDWDGVDGRELKESLSAKASNGNIIKISGTAETPERAQELADRVAKEYVAFAARLAGDTTDPDVATRPEALKKLVVQTSRRITDLSKESDPGRTVESVQGRTELEKLRTSLQDAIEKLDEVDPALNRANMALLGSAARPDGEAPPTRIQLIGAGALLFFLAAAIGHLARARVNRRLRGEQEIAAALGAAALGSVDVTRARSALDPQVGGRGGALRRFLGTDTRWDLPPLQASGGEAGRRLRFRRVHARLRDRLPAERGRLLLVVPEGDVVASKAAGHLIAETGVDWQPRVVGVSMARPLVPDHDGEVAAVIVTGAGQWTAAELTAVGEACTDAGHEIAGVVVAGTVRARDDESGPPLPDRGAPLAVGADARGGAV
ncbi:Wzz/FepE/Etk N-terminal domain-containing protein [Streptomyces sp. NPDC050418]|uniref:Wzz/FepE/Etk N-terminal domain-containing protein n=1 Tax=Streptomyces sp. NPDC050418 TaxID=3365612 RepID=UPI00379EF736